jgi:DUF971 family protein
MQPEQIANHRAGGVLEVLWDDGVRQQLTHRQVRAACRCSHCHAARLLGTPAALADDVRLDEIRQVGHYALQLVFSDGHDRGIYPWALLRSVGA